MVHNRRRFFRVHAGLRFTFEWEGGIELFRTVDLSAGGAQLIAFELESSLPRRGAVGECAFRLEFLEVRCLARVVRTSATGFAVQFVRLPKGLEDRICRWALRRELKEVHASP